MALRVTPPGEDSVKATRALPVPFYGPGNTPPGEDGVMRAEELENAADAASYDTGTAPGYNYDDPAENFLDIVRTAEQQAQLYTAQVNRRAWSQSYRAFHQEHYVGSKYTRPEWRGRSRLFVPKTRTAVRKDMAAVAASLFNSVDAITCLPGNEGDPRQRGAAAVMEELVNYRTDRTSDKASFPWFLVSMGARQDAQITGICVSKQCWLQEFRKVKETIATDQDGNPVLDETGVPKRRQHYVLDKDRPDMILFPPENTIVHPGADWTNPAQKSAYFILKYPMTVEEIQAKQEAPVNPWLPLPEAVLRTAVNAGKQDMEAIRRARELGLDRFDETQSGGEFQVVWVYETFVRRGGEDWCFYSLGAQHYLTKPKPTREVYPEQAGERPIAYGYGALESHRIYPQSPVESWQPLQVETNDLRNLTLDAVKQNVMPISKVVRGKRIDMDQIKRRSSGASIMVDSPEDVTWETPPQIGEVPIQMNNELTLEMDDLAGQQNYGSVETNNALGKTLGGLKLAAGAANAVQEFDIRIFIETWAQTALQQIVRLEQYYEQDTTVLGIVGQRAQLFQKFGINKIDNELLEQEVTVRVSAGLGAGDPQQRLAKFESAAQILTPLMQASPEWQSGQVEMNWEEVWTEVMGAVGYKDGGMRFVKINPAPKANPMMDLQSQRLMAEIQQRDRQGKGSFLTGLANVAKVALGKRDLEMQTVDMLLGHQGAAQQRGAQQGHQHNQTHLAALDHGHRHGLAIASHRRDLANDALNAAAQTVGEGAEQGSEAPVPPGSPAGAAAPGGPPAPSSASSSPAQPAQPQQQQPNPMDDRMAKLEDAFGKLAHHLTRPRKRTILRDEHNRIVGMQEE